MSDGRPPLPGRHLGLAWRPLTVRDEDSARLLLTRARAVDQSAHPDAPDLSPRRLDAIGTDLELDTLAGVDEQGELRAAAVVRRTADEVTLAAVVEPGWRGRGIGRAMLRWQDACAQREGSAVAQVLVDESRTDQRRLCAAAGFTSAGRVRTLQGLITADPRGDRADAGPRVVLEERESMLGRSWCARREVAEWAVLGGEPVPAGWPGHGGVRLRVTGPNPGPVAAELALPLLATALRAYAAADMTTARIDVDLHEAGVLEAAGTLGFTTLSDAVRYSTDPAARP